LKIFKELIKLNLIIPLIGAISFSPLLLRISGTKDTLICAAKIYPVAFKNIACKYAC
jgi:hypothetical protein